MIRNIVFVILVALVLIFVVQNMQVVEVKFLAWTISLSRALMIFGTLIIGIIAGWLLHFPKRRKDIKFSK
ncbi:MAG: LapA family protein [Desulfobacterales bacterium]|jgi:uncharacterized integral membrane protein